MRRISHFPCFPLTFCAAIEYQATSAALLQRLFIFAARIHASLQVGQIYERLVDPDVNGWNGRIETWRSCRFWDIIISDAANSHGALVKRINRLQRENAKKAKTDVVDSLRYWNERYDHLAGWRHSGDHDFLEEFEAGFDTAKSGREGDKRCIDVALVRVWVCFETESLSVWVLETKDHLIEMDCACLQDVPVIEDGLLKLEAWNKMAV
ncbi:hypothetical protein C8J56DRAFT_263250 [Mycena floridula]|nr:hypothetical protein C8J56DRAFT_263250 [Mycena floridula]